MTRVANLKPPKRAGGAPRLFCLPWRKLHNTVTETVVPPIAQEREHSIREDTFWRLGFLLAFLGHGVTLGLHQTVPADEGLSTAVRLAMGPRNQA